MNLRYQNKLRERRWAATFWGGMDSIAWFCFLKRNRFDINYSSLWTLRVIVVTSLFSLLNTFLRFVKFIIFGARVARHKITRPPLFIIGHWRTGTTLLHELLNLDPEFAAPTTYECFEPGHFLLTEKLGSSLLFFLVPPRRPMDEMPAGWARPQEEEFALCLLGLPSAYANIAFPNRLSQNQKYFDLDNLSPREQNCWEKTYLRFLKEVSFKNRGKRILLKSPPNSFRIKTLLKLFPDSKFILITRNPYLLFPSTMNLWKSLSKKFGLQKPDPNGLEAYVFSNFINLQQRLDEDRKRIDPSRFYELKYEDLISDPVGQLRSLYQHLALGSFEEVLPVLEKHLAHIKNFKPNDYKLTPELLEKISGEWGDIIRRDGYTLPLVKDSRTSH